MTHDYLISLIRPAVGALLVPSTVHMRRVPARCRGYGKARGPGEGLAPGPRSGPPLLGDANPRTTSTGGSALRVWRGESCHDLDSCSHCCGAP